MKTYRLRIKPQGSFVTPWHADTLFGNLCWIIAWREGEEPLAQFLKAYRDGNPFFVLSDGFPGDFIPAPLHLSLITNQSDSFEEYQKAKKLKQVLWLTPKDFETIRYGNAETEPAVIDAFEAFTTIHSTINRITGTTGEEGSLYELQEYALKSAEIISVYIKIKDGWEEKVLSLFKDLSLIGYGKKKSVGKGCFEIIGGLDLFDNFDTLNEANGFISFSNFVPAKCDPTDGFYKIIVKYGKLGGNFTFNGNPFKKPLMMFASGSVFKVEGDIKPFYGRIVEGISSAKPEVVQYGFAFAVPIKIDI